MYWSFGMCDFVNHWVTAFEDPPVETVNKEVMEAEIKKLETQYKEQLQNTVDELESIKGKAQLTDEERKTLNAKLQAANKQLKTAEQLAAEEKKKLEQQHTKQLTDLTEERDIWKSRYTESTINTAIVNAAVKSKAYNPRQLVAIVGPQTTLVDKDGTLAPMTKLNTTNDKGETVELILPVDEAIAKIADMEEYANLFQVEGSPGTGRQPNKGKGPDLKSLLKDPVAYRKARADGTLSME